MPMREKIYAIDSFQMKRVHINSSKNLHVKRAKIIIQLLPLLITYAKILFEY